MHHTTPKHRCTDVSPLPTKRVRVSLFNSCTSVFTRHFTLPMSRPGTMSMGNVAVVDSVATKVFSSFPSSKRKKVAGGVPLDVQQVTVPPYTSASLEMLNVILGWERYAEKVQTEAKTGEVEEEVVCHINKYQSNKPAHGRNSMR